MKGGFDTLNEVEIMSYSRYFRLLKHELSTIYRNNQLIELLKDKLKQIKELVILRKKEFESKKEKQENNKFIGFMNKLLKNCRLK